MPYNTYTHTYTPYKGYEGGKGSQGNNERRTMDVGAQSGRIRVIMTIQIITK
jgi:hypothetical protein